MKLGVCYMVFDGEEFLEPAIKSIREQTEFVSVTWQKTSYHGNKTDTDIEGLINQLKKDKLIDQDIFFEPDLSELPRP